MSTDNPIDNCRRTLCRHGAFVTGHRDHRSFCWPSRHTGFTGARSCGCLYSLSRNKRPRPLGMWKDSDLPERDDPVAAVQRDVRGRAACSSPSPASVTRATASRSRSSTTRPTRRRRSASARSPTSRAASPSSRSNTSTASTALGFKAGALENGLKTAKGEFIMIFDADFLLAARRRARAQHPLLPRPQGRRRAVPLGARQPRLLGAHRGPGALLDGHFIKEHAGRNWSGRFFNFNGTAGMWRRAAIDAAGGWQHDTLTEDTDLSYRRAAARLEVRLRPRDHRARRAARRDVGLSCRSSSAGPRARCRSRASCSRRSCAARTRRSRRSPRAFFHLTNNLAYPLLVILSLLLVPNLALRGHHGWREVLMIDLPLFFGTTLSIASFYLASEREIAKMREPGVRPKFEWATLKRLPLVMSVGIGLCINQTRAVLEALAGRESEFVRTPKHGVRGKLESWSKQEVPRCQTHHAVHRAARHGGLFRCSRPGVAFSARSLSCRCRSSRCFCAAFGYVGWVSPRQGGVGLCCCAAPSCGCSRRGCATTVIVPPPGLRRHEREVARAGLARRGGVRFVRRAGEPLMTPSCGLVRPRFGRDPILPSVAPLPARGHGAVDAGAVDERVGRGGFAFHALMTVGAIRGRRAERPADERTEDPAARSRDVGGAVSFRPSRQIPPAHDFASSAVSARTHRARPPRTPVPDRDRGGRGWRAGDAVREGESFDLGRPTRRATARCEKSPT